MIETIEVSFLSLEKKKDRLKMGMEWQTEKTQQN